jgi:hypothetical protein
MNKIKEMCGEVRLQTIFSKLWGLSQSIEDQITEINEEINNKGKTEGFSFTKQSKSKSTKPAADITLISPVSPVKLLTGDVAH